MAKILGLPNYRHTSISAPLRFPRVLAPPCQIPFSVNPNPKTNLGMSYCKSHAFTPKGVEWCVDSGAPRHLSPDESGFENKRLLPDCVVLKQSDGKVLTGQVVGDVVCPGLVLKGVLCVPGIDQHIMSVVCLAESDVTVYFDSEVCIFRELSTGKTIATGVRDEKQLYSIERRIEE